MSDLRRVRQLRRDSIHRTYAEMWVEWGRLSREDALGMTAALLDMHIEEVARVVLEETGEAEKDI